MPVRREDIDELNETNDHPLQSARDYANHPPEPDKLHIERQLEKHLNRVTPDEVNVEVNTRFRTTLAKVRDGGRTLSVSWDLFDSEQYYRGDGWSVLCFVAKITLEEEGLPTGGL